MSRFYLYANPPGKLSGGFTTTIGITSSSRYFALTIRTSVIRSLFYLSQCYSDTIIAYSAPCPFKEVSLFLSCIHA